MDSDRTIIDIWKDTDKIVEDLPASGNTGSNPALISCLAATTSAATALCLCAGTGAQPKPGKILSGKIEGLVKDGVVEVMLLGQNVNSYGKNLEHPISFAELLRRVEQIEGWRGSAL